MSNEDKALRPKFLDDYEGQPLLVKQLRIRMAGAKARGESLPHILLSGPPGLGKTTLAYIIANEMKAKVHVVMGPGLEKPSDLFSIFGKLGAGDVLFIDEIHACPRFVSEYFYPAMEDGVIEMSVTSPMDTYRWLHPLPAFTLIGATTQPGLLEEPLRARFGAPLTLELYTPDVLANILRRNAVKLGMTCDDDALRLLAARARGTPRIANHLLRFAQDFTAGGRLTLDAANESLEIQQIDKLGLTEQDRKYLKLLMRRKHPVGEQAVAASLGLKRDTISGVIEPYLLQQDLIERTPRGRVITDAGLAHMQSLTPVSESFFATV